MDLLKNILEYEKSVINKFTTGRTKFIEILSELELKKYNYDKLLIMTYDLKSIIDPIKTSTDAIDHFIENLQSDFQCNSSMENEKNILQLLLLHSITST